MENDLISRSEVIKTLDNIEIGKFNRINVIETIKSISPTEQPQGEWIPIKYRPMTDEEFEEYRNGFGNPDEVPDGIRVFDCPMPSDGQEVLVTLKNGEVVIDTFYNDGCCLYFEIWCDDGDVIAWQPLPEPYKKGDTE